MKFLEQMQLLERIDQLIKLKATGTPTELAARLGVSERTVYNILETLRDLGVAINYNKQRKTYYYEGNITIQFLKVKVENTEKIKGGENKIYFFSKLQKFCSLEADLYTKLINTDEQNDAGGFGALEV